MLGVHQETFLSRYITFSSKTVMVADIAAELKNRYREQHKRYFDQLVVQVEQEARGEVLSRNVQTYLDVRRGTIGAYPAICIAECAQGIQLPDSAFNHDSMQECMRISADLVIL